MATAKYKRGTDGYFQAKVWDGTYTAAGKKHYIPLRSAKSSRDLENRVEHFKRAVAERSSVPKTDMTYIAYARKWKDVYKHSTESNTKAMYDNIIEKHLIILGNVKLQEISRLHLQLILNHASGKARTQQQIQMAFLQILNAAVSDKLYPANLYDELRRTAEKINYTPKEKRPLTSIEKKAIFDANYKYTQDKVLVYLLYGCGLRREEVLALTVFDFNFVNNTVSINKAYEYTQNTPKIKCTKSKNGNRVLPIPQKILPDIKAYVNNAKQCGRSNIFVMKGGKPISKSSYDKMWKRILDSLQNAAEEQIEGLTAHIFRHNYCTELCYQIPLISINKVAELVGDTINVIYAVYLHTLQEKENAEKAVNQALNF